MGLTVWYTLEKPFSDGTVAVDMGPLSLLTAQTRLLMDDPLTSTP